MIDTILYFYIYSFLGCIIEEIYNFILTGNFTHRRTMYSMPACPVYGLGAVLISTFATGNWMLNFVIGFFAASAAEFLYSFIWEKSCGVLWWDYSGDFANISGRVCAFYSVCWGILSVLFIRFVHPAVKHMVGNMSGFLKIILCAVLTLWFVSDVSRTVKLLRFERTHAKELFPFIKLVNNQ